MKTFSKIAIMVTAGWLLIGCAPQIRTEYDEDNDFSRFKTYTWQPPEIRRVQNPILDSQLLTDRVSRAVRDVLNRRGYREVDQGADFIVTYHTASKEKITSSPFSIGVGYGHYGRWGHSVIFDGPDIRSQEEAVLILDVICCESNKLAWRGWDTSLVSQKNFSEPAVRQSVEQILSKFPPSES